PGEFWACASPKSFVHLCTEVVDGWRIAASATDSAALVVLIGDQIVHGFLRGSLGRLQGKDFSNQGRVLDTVVAPTATPGGIKALQQAEVGKFPQPALVKGNALLFALVSDPLAAEGVVSVLGVVQADP